MVKALKARYKVGDWVFIGQLINTPLVNSPTYASVIGPLPIESVWIAPAHGSLSDHGVQFDGAAIKYQFAGGVLAEEQWIRRTSQDAMQFCLKALQIQKELDADREAAYDE